VPTAVIRASDSVKKFGMKTASLTADEGKSSVKTVFIEIIEKV
jgi:hypothetical protein